jgi:hypothetical protein
VRGLYFNNPDLAPDNPWAIERLKRIRFIDCKADKMTYAFLKNGKADMTGITLLTP